MKKLIKVIFVSGFVLFISCSSQEKAQENMELTNEKIPPGSVIVNCEIQKFEFSKDTYLISAVVKSVHGYGSDTKIVIEGEKIFFNVSAELFEKNTFTIGNVLLFELSQTGNGTETGLDMKSNEIWNYVRVVKR